MHNNVQCFLYNTNILLFSFGVFNIYATTESNLDYKTLFESFVIPGHGVLTMNIPKIWNYNFTTTGIDQPPIITFYNLDKDKEEIYQLNLKSTLIGNNELLLQRHVLVIKAFL